MNAQNEQNQKVIESKKQSVTMPLRKSISLIVSKPIVILPILLGTIILRYVGVLLAPWTTDIFEWFWFGDFSLYSTQTILWNLLLFAVGAILIILVHFVSIDMARDVYLAKEPKIPKSAKYVVRNLPILIIAAALGQLLLLTDILIPIGLLVFIIAVVERGSPARMLSGAIKVFIHKPVEMIILTIAWVVWRAFLTLFNVPFVFELSFIMDMIVEFGVLYLYLSEQKTLKSI
jgi:hypothetical protein